MSERRAYEPGVPCWVSSVQHDPQAAIPFYREVMGWEIEELMPPDHPGSYAICRLKGRKVAAIVSTHPAPPPPSPMWTTHVSVDDVDEAVTRVSECGGSVVADPFDSPAGGRMAVVADPAGAVFALWQPGEHHGAELVNEPGAWAMSMLQTPDPASVTGFYSAVFGWTTEPMQMGPMTVTLWRLPGYVGGEPHQPVSREVVAAMVQSPEGQSQWRVDFWIDDADAAAGRAERLGGRVIAPPHDVPGFRRAELADPGSGAFSVSTLVV